jgi:hypothetical protein
LLGTWRECYTVKKRDGKKKLLGGETIEMLMKGGREV